MSDHNNPKEGSKADEKGPMSNTGEVTVAMGINENRTVRARDGHQADEQFALTGVAPFWVFAEGSSKEPAREGFIGSVAVDSADGVSEEGGGDGGEKLAFLIVETDKQSHVLLLNEVVEDRARELKGLRHLGIQFLIIEDDRCRVDAKKGAAKPRGLSVFGVDSPEGKRLPKKDGEFVGVEFDARGGWKVLREGR